MRRSGAVATKDDIHNGYLDMPSTPLFSFGHGLSYTTFDYSPLKVPSDTVNVGGELRASLTVKNAGKRRGTEVVQLYAADTATGVTLPRHYDTGLLSLGSLASKIRAKQQLPGPVTMSGNGSYEISEELFVGT